MKKRITLLFLFLTLTTFAQDITGNWYGKLIVPGGGIRMGINVTKTDAGYTATLDSPDQGVNSIPVQDVFFENNILVFSLAVANVTYKGTLEGTTINGTFSQNGQNLPLNFGREKIEVIKPNRPQEPKAPFPYYSEEVTFKNEKAGIILAGTLTLPKKEGNYPAVVLISGSGPQDRNEEIMDHKPFLVLADYLTRNGIAVLRYDDRGVAQSKGNFNTATTADFATDAEAAFNFLKTRNEINKKKIGLIGHSEGGTIAPIVASTNADVAFIVLMAGSNIPGDELLLLQNYMIGKADGMPEEELTKLAAINRKLYDAVINESEPTALKAKLNAVYSKELKPLFISKGIPPAQVQQYMEMQINELAAPWNNYFIKYNPTATLEKVNCPILAINGSNDLQVAAKANLDAVKRATQKSGNKKVTIKELPGLNHLFQESATGVPSEYGELEQTIAPVALEEMNNWIQKQVK